jgi:hypothetical protein
LTTLRNGSEVGFEEMIVSGSSRIAVHRIPDFGENLRFTVQHGPAVMAFALNRGTARRKKHCHPPGCATRDVVTR